MEVPPGMKWAPLTGGIQYDSAHINGAGTGSAGIWIRADAPELMTPHQASLLRLSKVIVRYELDCPAEEARILNMGALRDDGTAGTIIAGGEYFMLRQDDVFHRALLNTACHR